MLIIKQMTDGHFYFLWNWLYELSWSSNNSTTQDDSLSWSPLRRTPFGLNADTIIRGLYYFYFLNNFKSVLLFIFLVKMAVYNSHLPIWNDNREFKLLYLVDRDSIYAFCTIVYGVSITFFHLFHCVSVYNYSWICVNFKTKHLYHFCVNKNHY